MRNGIPKVGNLRCRRLLMYARSAACGCVGAVSRDWRRQLVCVRGDQIVARIIINRASHRQSPSARQHQAAQCGPLAAKLISARGILRERVAAETLARYK